MRKITLRNPIFFVYIFMAESAELADKLQRSVCRWTSVPVNFQVCDWGATDTLTAVRAWSRGLQLFNLPVQEVWITLILEKTLHQLPKGLRSMWTWTDHCTAHQNKTTMIKEAEWSKVPGLSCRSSAEFMGARVWDQLNWAQGTAQGGTGARCRLPMDTRRAGQESWATVAQGRISHC